MKKLIVSSIEKVDELFSKTYLKLFKERNSLMVFLFHSLFRNENEINSGVIDANIQQAITIEHFRKFIEYYLNNGYIFVSPEDILNGLKKDKKYALITFDDGYYNNYFALPVLNEFKASAVFFISANHVKENKSFWWDALYRERKKQNVSIEEIYKEKGELMSKTNDGIEKYLIDKFGKKSLIPIGDIDRPFTPSELKDFSKNKYVFIGNHTNNHAILTNYVSSGIKSEIFDAQNNIYQMTGVIPNIIAYPNGNFSDEIINISKEVGLKLGVTVIPKKNYFPINNIFTLNRFVLSGNKLEKQCELYRSDIQLMAIIRKLLNK